MSPQGSADVIRLQEYLNYFTEHFLEGLTPLNVDDVLGPLTERRVQVAKRQLGYDDLSPEWTDEQQRRLRHPKDPELAPADVIARGEERRIAQRKAWHDNLAAAAHVSGVTTFDGKPCARWMVPYLQWARTKGGWKGHLESGYRDPAYSEHLCMVMCGHPTCLGRCAGRGSNHSGDVPPHGAIDVTEYQQFGQAMKRCALQPRIFNALPSDPVHFSASGR